MMPAEKLIEKLALVPHPEEGGYYRETYRSEEKISRGALPGRYLEDKSFGTAIYYLLIPGTCSILHRLKSDEIIHFYLGDPVIMLQLFPDGKGKLIKLGNDLAGGQEVQVLIPTGTWMGMLLEAEGSLALMGATVAPGFDFSDYQGGERNELVRQYPVYRDLIVRLTPAGIWKSKNT